MRTCTGGGESVREQSWQVGTGRQRHEVRGRGRGAPIHRHAQAADAVVVPGENSHLLAGEGIPHICGRVRVRVRVRDITLDDAHKGMANGSVDFVWNDVSWDPTVLRNWWFKLAPGGVMAAVCACVAGGGGAGPGGAGAAAGAAAGAGAGGGGGAHSS